MMTESLSSDWTDEKHSLYLKSMEASFVNQLYDNRQKHLNTRTPSGQVFNFLFSFIHCVFKQVGPWCDDKRGV
jgi:hypothetical protein